MKPPLAVLSLVMALGWAALAGETSPTLAPLGSPEFSPSRERPVGWRGDWTGCWPGAQPPVEWSRHDKVLLDHVCQARKHKNGKPEGGQQLFNGLVRQWLLLGPFKADDKDKAMDHPFIAETEVQPDEGEKSGDCAWTYFDGTPVNMATHNNYGGVGVNFHRAFGMDVTNAAAYAHAYVYSPAGGVFKMKVGGRAWLNGVPLVKNGDKASDVTFKTGWNRLLVKSYWGDKKADNEYQAWKFCCELEPRTPGAAEKNIRWVTRMPGHSVAAPIVVGDRIFVTADPCFVACLSADDGKYRWIRSMHLFEGTEDEPVKSFAGLKEQAAPLVEKLHTANDALAKLANEGKPGDGGRGEVLKKLGELLKELDPKFHESYTKAWEQSQPGWTVTPCSDGKRLYVWSHTGAAACFDLDGNRLWMRQEPFPGNRHHGYAASPVLIGNTFITFENTIRAYDAATGKTLWTHKPQHLTYGSLVPVRFGNDPAVLTGEGTILTVADGAAQCGGKLGTHLVTTPVAHEDVFYAFTAVPKHGFNAFTLPERPGPPTSLWKNPLKGLGTGGGWAGGTCASPLFLDGLVYNLSMTGVVWVHDAKTGEIVYTRQLDLAPPMAYVSSPGACASLSLGGKYLYAVDNTFTTVVFEPGRTFKQVAKNSVQGEGQTWSYFVFAGTRAYYRSPGNLCCFEEH